MKNVTIITEEKTFEFLFDKVQHRHFHYFHNLTNDEILSKIKDLLDNPNV